MPEQVMELEELLRRIDALLAVPDEASSTSSWEAPKQSDLVPSDITLSSNKEELLYILDELQPFDIASVLSGLQEPKQWALLSLLPPDIAAEVLGYLDHDHQYRALDHLEESVTWAIVAEMPSDQLVDLLGAIHPLQAREILKRVPSEDLSHIRQMMTYSDDSAGGLMTVSYLAARADWTAERVIAHFRKVGHDVEESSYVYVVDRAGRLVGVASMREVILADPKTLVSEIMYTKTITISVDADQEEAARLVSQYDFAALPVINSQGRLVGIITADDIIDVVEEEATEDIHRLGGTTPIETSYLQAGVRELFRKRVGWLLVLFVAESLTGSIMRYYEGFLNQVIALAFFIPLLIDTGGNSGSQASTLVIRAMALGEVTPKDLTKVVWQETRVGLMLGLVMGFCAFGRAVFMGGSPALGLTVAFTITAIVIVSSASGAVLPILGQRVGVDPAVFSAPLITTVADGVGLLIYFQMARMILGLGA